MTAYDVLKNRDMTIDITESEFNQLIKDYCTAFFTEKNYDERLGLHRNPIELQNEILQELYHQLTIIQNRAELRFVEQRGEITVGGYVHSEINETWKADKRLPTLYHAMIVYCKRTSRNFIMTAAHIGEYLALLEMVSKMQQDIHQTNSGKVVNSIPQKIKKERIKIPKPTKVRAELQKEIGSQCPFCDNADVGHFEIHHIDEDPSHNEAINLILLCPTCHSKIGKADITREQVIQRKQELLNTVKKTAENGKAINIHGGVANIISGGTNTIHIKQTKKSSSIEYPAGCIGSDLLKANYIGYLIDRYEEYKLKELGKENMRYGILRRQLKIEYKIGKARKVEHIPLVQFEALVKQLQKKIDGTMIARKNGKLHRNYDSYAEYEAARSVANKTS